MPEVTKKGKKTQKVDVPNAENMDLGQLYDEIDAKRKVRGVGHANVNAEQIREIRDELFAAGKDKVSVATLRIMINKKFGLEKTEDGDTRIQNSSVRSAAGTGDFEIVKEGSVAYIVRKA